MVDNGNMDVRSILALSLAALVAGGAGAQTESPESELPAFERGGGEAVAPKGGNVIGSAALDARLSSLPPDFEVPGAQLVPEGTYLPRVVGRAIRTARGEVVFAPDRDQPAENSAGLPSPLPLLVLLPSVRRDQLALALADDPLGVNGSAEQVVQRATEPKPYCVGGQVYVYRGRSYLLCSTFAALSAKPKGTSQDPQGAQDAGAKTSTSVDQLIQDLERASEERRVLTPNAGGTPRRREKNDDTVVAATTEGSIVTNRRGRLIRLPEEGGRLAFVVDNDPDSPALPQMVLLPCQVLEEIEGMVAARGPELVVKISGRVVTSGPKAALLPVFFQVERRTDITPGQ